MIKRMSVRDARAHVADALAEVKYTKVPVMIERKGQPMAVMLSPDQWSDFERYLNQQLKEALERTWEANSHLDPDAVYRLVTEVTEEVKQELHEERLRNAHGRD